RYVQGTLARSNHGRCLPDVHAEAGWAHRSFYDEGRIALGGLQRRLSRSIVHTGGRAENRVERPSRTITGPWRAPLGVVAGCAAWAVLPHPRRVRLRAPSRL